MAKGMIRSLTVLLAVTLAVTASGALMAAGVPIPGVPRWIDATPDLIDYSNEVLSRFSEKELAEANAAGPERTQGVRVGQKETFWSLDVSVRQPYQLDATLRYIGKHCYIYVQDGQEMTDARARELATQFDEQIYPTDRAWFGSEPTPGFDGDPRITLLFLDILDGWEPGRGYVAGYFFPLDTQSRRVFEQSNEREMFYLDMHPGDPNRDDYLGILAHEFQHMIHWNEDPHETKWLNESMAQLAFYVNDYGHAPQIYTYIRDTDSRFDRFDNTLEDYGRTYLFTYYLYEKYAGETIDEKRAFFKELVASQEKGPASVASLLQSHGVERSLQDIMVDFFTATAVNDPRLDGGRYAYGDPALRFRVQATRLHTPATYPTGKEQGVLSRESAEYIRFTRRNDYSPDRPTAVDRIFIEGSEGGRVLWNVNEGILPPERLIPEGSTRMQEGLVSTPFTQDEEGKWGARIGPFLRLPTVIKNLNFRKQSESGEITPEIRAPIYSLRAAGSVLADITARRPRGAVEFHFQGKRGMVFNRKAEYRLRAIKDTLDGRTTVEDVPLDDKFRGSYAFDLGATDTEGVTFMVLNTAGSKKKNKYTYTVKGSSSLNADVDAAVRLAGLEDAAGKALSENKSDRDLVAFHSSVREAQEDVLGRISRRLAAEDGAASELSRTLAALKQAGKEDEARARRDVLRQALRRARYNVLDGGSSADALGLGDLLSLAPGSLKGDDEDDSHDNLLYLLNQKGELIHSLTHLKIDPVFVEGQLLKLWRLLELTRGFPHLPIPDGLGIVDYNEDEAKAVLAQWATDFDVPWEGPGGQAVSVPAERPVPYTDDQEKVKDTVRRLILAESIIEFSYDNGLYLAEDVAMSGMWFAKLVLAANTTIRDIGKYFTDVPIAGPIAKALQRRILASVFGLTERFARFLGTRLNPPYNQIAPTAIILLTGLAARVTGYPIDRDNPSFWRDLAVKTLGKYALTSVPRIGYVARGQGAVDLATEYASSLTFTGSLEEARKRVWDDESSETESSVREVVAREITSRHATAQKDIEHHKTAKLIAKILAYGSVIDPTSITKVASMLAAATSGGFLAHAGWKTGSYFFRLPKGDMLRGVHLAYDPGWAQDDSLREAPLPRAKVDPASTRKLMTELEEAYDIFERRVEEAFAPGLAEVELARKVEALEEADDRVRLVAGKAEALILSEGAGGEGDGGVRELYGAAQNEEMHRTEVLAKLFARVVDKDGEHEVPAVRTTSSRQYFDVLERGLQRVAKSARGVPATLVVTRIKVKGSAPDYKLQAWVENTSSTDASGITVGLTSDLDFSVEGEVTRSIGSLRAGDSKKLTWMIHLNEEDHPAPLVAVIPEASQARGLSGIAYLH